MAEHPKFRGCPSGPILLGFVELASVLGPFIVVGCREALRVQPVAVVVVVFVVEPGDRALRSKATQQQWPRAPTRRIGTTTMRRWRGSRKASRLPTSPAPIETAAAEEKDQEEDYQERIGGHRIRLFPEVSILGRTWLSVIATSGVGITGRHRHRHA
jgi:hypothetical protein